MRNSVSCHQHIAIIHPSFIISRDPSSVEKLDSLLYFIRTNVNAKPIPIRQLEAGLVNLNQVLDEFFMKHKDALAYRAFNGSESTDYLVA